MNSIEGVFAWAGGTLFVSALIFCGYSFVSVWARTGPFDGRALVIDAILFSLFALHHSLFAREPVKQRLASVVPERLLRSVYVWFASLLLMLVCGAWRPVGGDVFDVNGWRAVAHAVVQVAGVLIIAAAVRAIDPLELAGIRPHSAAVPLQVTGPYRWVRHPLYLGWLLATFGPAHMTGDRLAFAVISIAYLVLAVPLEERSLIDSFGGEYLRYRQLVRWRIVPYVF